MLRLLKSEVVVEYVKRHMRDKLLGLLGQYPVITIMGPRQAGKTTLAKYSLPDFDYINLEDPVTRQVILEDPRAFFAKYPSHLIIDEIQRMPELLSHIQVIVDQQPEKTGLFVLTGSHQLELHQAISQSLAGRTAILTLLPLAFCETEDQDISVDELLIKGFYPRIYQKNLNPTEAYQYYFQTYIERDVRQLIHIQDLNLFIKFIKICAGRIGQVINWNSMSNDVGVSAQTIQRWTSLLEASYILMRLPPYFENFGKRMIKTPKLYFVDVGLAAFLLDIESTHQMARDPLRGHLFENFIIMDLIKQRYNQGKSVPFYYFRDQHGHEVDLLIKSGHEFMGIEIKAGQSFHRDFLKGLDFFQGLTTDRYREGYIVYAGNEEQKLGQHALANYRSFLSRFTQA
jgi:predicted AAA+ superfamily ATPase